MNAGHPHTAGTSAKDQARDLIQAAHWAEAIPVIERCLASHRTDCELHYWLGMAHANLENHEEARRALKRALKYGPSHAAIHLAYGKVLLELEAYAPATDALRTAARLNERDGDAWHNLARASMMGGRLDAAAKAVARAQALLPDDPQVHFTMGTIAAADNRHEDAISAFEQAITLAPDFAEAYNELGNTRQLAGQYGQAEAAYRKAMELVPGNPEPMVNLGIILERLHRTEEALDMANRALAHAPGHWGANLLHARIRLRMGEAAEAVQRLEQLTTTLPESRARAITLMDLGTARDRQGDHAGALATWSEAKALYWRSIKGIGKQAATTLRRAQAHREWLEQTDISLPDEPIDPCPVFLVGFPRSGTTLMEQILESHPRLIGSRERPVIADLVNDLKSIISPGFRYPKDLTKLTPEQRDRLRQRYYNGFRELLDAAPAGTILVDKLPLNLIELPLILTLFPRAPIIMALRDPRDACLSCFAQNFELNAAMACFLKMDTTVALYDAVLRLWNAGRARMDIHFHEYRYEDLVASPETTIGGVLEFLGLEWNDSVLDFHQYAKQRYANTPSYQAVTQPIYRSAEGRWRHYTDALAPYGDTLAPHIRQYGYPEA